MTDPNLIQAIERLVDIECFMAALLFILVVAFISFAILKDMGGKRG